ncbi:unnamed protein product, partial [Rotaria sordida]
GIYPYDSRIIRRDKLIKNGIITSTTNTINRSLSVEFDESSQSNHLTSTNTTTVKQKKLLKYPSAPDLRS